MDTAIGWCAVRTEKMAGRVARAIFSVAKEVLGQLLLPAVVQRMPFPSHMHLGDMVSLKMRDIQVIKLWAAKSTVCWSLCFFAFRIIE